MPGAVIDMLEKTGANSSRPDNLDAAFGLRDGQYYLSDVQAQAILDLRLHRLTGLEQEKIVTDYSALLDVIASLLEILESPERLMAVIREELEEIKEKFGDQKYLDDWTVRFEGVHVLKNLGGGVAPWNIQQYKLEEKLFELIFYHFHDLKFLYKNQVDLGGYQLRKEDIKILYKPYLNHLKTIEKNILFSNDRNYFHHMTTIKKFNLKDLKKKILRRFFYKPYNIYNISYILGL